jgi:predicted RNA-binding Zn-ribbon protein involved in translation (DUF1610 family)
VSESECASRGARGGAQRCTQRRFFCTLCGREVAADERGHYPCSHCAADHVVRCYADGRLYLARTISVWRDLNGRNYSALVFSDAALGTTALGTTEAG